MKAPLTQDELDLLRRVAAVQEEEVVNFCIELEIVPEEPFAVDAVVDRVFEALLEMASQGGLPVSKYDADDLSGFDVAGLTALARGLGLKPNPRFGTDALIEQIVRGMRKTRRKLPRRSQIPMMLTYFLPALVRHFSAR